jgi:hypothetical protein
MALCCGFASADVAVFIGVGTANIGGTAEVPITLDVGANPPASVVLFLKYDTAKLAPATDYFQSAVKNLAGPVSDGQGNVLMEKTAVQAATAVSGLNKLIESEVHADTGVVGVAIAGLNETPLVSGQFITVAFKILSAASENEQLPITGLDAAGPKILLDGQHRALSTAADGGAAAVAVTCSSGMVQVGCTAPGTPTGVTATQDQAAKVTISWTAVADAQSYRVFRSNDANPSNAQAIGTDWQPATTYDDLSAAEPTVTTPAGCFRAAVYAPVQYDYFVEAKNAVGCVSSLSAPVLGARGAAKALTTAGIWPSSPADRGGLLSSLATVLVLAGFPIARRMRG